MTGTCDNNDGKEIKKNENESIIFIAKPKEGEGAKGMRKWRLWLRSIVKMCPLN